MVSIVSATNERVIHDLLEIEWHPVSSVSNAIYFTQFVTDQQNSGFLANLESTQSSTG